MTIGNYGAPRQHQQPSAAYKCVAYVNHMGVPAHQRQVAGLVEALGEGCSSQTPALRELDCFKERCKPMRLHRYRGVHLLLLNLEISSTYTLPLEDAHHGSHQRP